MEAESGAAKSPVMRWSYLLLTLLAVGCSVPEKPVGTALDVQAPLGLPRVPIPENNPPTRATVALGRKLFYDGRLSGDGTVSCGFCHDPALSFADGRRVSVGSGGKSGKRNAPTVLNAAYQSLQFWDGRAQSLEAQILSPLESILEMNQSHDLSLTKLSRDPETVKLFEQAYGAGPITIGKVQKALASFERTLLSARSPFDRYMFANDKDALSESAVRGLALFRAEDKGNCATCHLIASDWALFADGKFHNLGIGVDGEGKLSDNGRYNESGVDGDQGAFKTPSLRNVAETAPYMHDGSLKTLRAVVDYYAGGGNSNDWLDKEMKPLPLSGRDREDLVAFLESLTGEMPRDAGRP